MTELTTEAVPRPDAEAIRAAVRALIAEPPPYPRRALEQQGITLLVLRQYARGTRTPEELEELRQLMVAAGKTRQPDEEDLADQIQRWLDPIRRAWDRIEEAYRQGQMLTALVTGMSKEGLNVEVLGHPGLMPAPHATADGRTDPKRLIRLVGTELPVRIVKLDPNAARRREKLIVSHRVLAEAERRERTRAVLATLQEGEIREGTVRRVREIGAFVDIGGVEGLLHVTEIAWRRVANPADVLKPGQRIPVKILQIDREAGRIRLSLRQTQPDPWPEASRRYAPGTTVEGTVREIVPAGAVVQLDDAIDGFLPLREIARRRIQSAEEVLKVGEPVTAVVLEQRPRDRSVVLSIRELEERHERHEVESFRRRQRESGRTTLGDLFGHLLSSLKETLAQEESAPEPAPAAEAPAPAADGVAAAPRRSRSRRSAPAGDPAPAEASAEPTTTEPSVEPVAAEPAAAKPARTRSRKRAIADNAAEGEAAPPDGEAAAEPPRRSRRRKPPDAPAEASVVNGDQEAPTAEVAAEEAPAPAAESSVPSP